MRVHALAIGLAFALAAGGAHAQTPPPENPGPAIQGNSDPDMPAKTKPMAKKKGAKKMKKGKM